jgi:hypothetical protein
LPRRTGLGKLSHDTSIVPKTESKLANVWFASARAFARSLLGWKHSSSNGLLGRDEANAVPRVAYDELYMAVYASNNAMR